MDSLSDDRLSIQPFIAKEELSLFATIGISFIHVISSFLIKALCLHPWDTIWVSARIWASRIAIL